MENLEGYKVRKSNVKIKEEVLKNANFVYEARMDIIDGFSKNLFLMKPSVRKESAEPEESEESEDRIPLWIRFQKKCLIK